MRTNAEYLAAMHTMTEPTVPGTYLRIFHGRTSKNQDLDDWGSEGGYFGPLDFVHVTYMCCIGLRRAGDEDGTGPMLSFGESEEPPTRQQQDNNPLHFDDDLLYYKGVWYGDWSVFSVGAK
jgi:hypothetical protein